ncbi:inhibitor of growth protein 1 [Exaiptasia diaphana]|uniref:Inhibitor of growth protein n=1 Tax=Exaiptasia diaphana TaxID=2652724 RepID=A0A913YZZ8_EXADI|nr:inhibitor of growth protein 1 [Exaiptasia diaphana]XP_028519691.1 inhibitor of growth protein 1 [Exaiptasia diaphana]XP_028519692.1 inhibitor of growth protein 1 [Exaiptasia diaphana]KXJ28251.1 Inhibitor of growth protein 1 [Exaiptasia diaphana]
MESSLGHVTTSLENFLEFTESLPDDMQRSMTQMRELDRHYQDRLKEIERLIHSYRREKDSALKRKYLIQIQRRLVKSQEYGDEKLQLVGHMMDLVDNKSRQVEIDMENLETYRNDDTPTPIIKHDSPAVSLHEEHVSVTKTTEKTKRNRRQRNHDKRESETGGGSSGGGENQKPVKKKAKVSRKKTKNQSSPQADIPIDPNEPTYCLCKQVSFGEMIGCDNDECEIEWFHFQCVGLTTKPKGKWYCPKCTPPERKKDRNYNK